MVDQHTHTGAANVDGQAKPERGPMGNTTATSPAACRVADAIAEVEGLLFANDEGVPDALLALVAPDDRILRAWKKGDVRRLFAVAAWSMRTRALAAALGAVNQAAPRTESDTPPPCLAPQEIASLPGLVTFGVPGCRALVARALARLPHADRLVVTAESAWLLAGPAHAECLSDAQLKGRRLFVLGHGILNMPEEEQILVVLRGAALVALHARRRQEPAGPECDPQEPAGEARHAAAAEFQDAVARVGCEANALVLEWLADWAASRRDGLATAVSYLAL